MVRGTSTPLTCGKDAASVRATASTTFLRFALAAYVEHERSARLEAGARKVEELSRRELKRQVGKTKGVDDDEVVAALIAREKSPTVVDNHLDAGGQAEVTARHVNDGGVELHAN